MKLASTKVIAACVLTLATGVAIADTAKSDGIMEISKAIAKMKPSQLAVFGDLLKTGDLKYEENEDRS